MKVVIYKGKGRQKWRFRLVSANHHIVAVSEGYLTKWNVKRAVKKAFPDFPIEYRD